MAFVEVDVEVGSESCDVSSGRCVNWFNYVLDINQELLVSERLNQIEFGSRLDDDFHRNLASMKSKNLFIPSSSKNLQGINLNGAWVLKALMS